ncbi:MAG: hypothetical protein RLY93_20745 [Sumerlaeia bacterium]
MAPKLETLLSKAALGGDLAEVERLLDAGADPTKPLRKGEAPIAVKVAERGQTIVLDRMIERGLDLMAMCEGDEDSYRLGGRIRLLDAMLLTYKNAASEYVLDWFIKRDGPEKGAANFFRLAIHTGTYWGPNKAMRESRPPDSYTYEDGRTVAELIDEVQPPSFREALRKLKPAKPRGESAPMTASQRKSAMLSAVKTGDIGAIRALVAQGFDIETSIQRGGAALLHAAGNGQPLVVEYLISRGANLEARDADGSRALEKAIYHANKMALAEGKIECARLLVAAGTSLEGDLGQQCLDIACRHDPSGRIAQMLLDAGVGEGAVLDEQLLAACHKGMTGSVEVILKSGRADVNCQGTDRMTPLHLVCFGEYNHYSDPFRHRAPFQRGATYKQPKSGDKKIAKLLLEHGADPWIEDGWGRSVAGCEEPGHQTVQVVRDWAEKHGGKPKAK